MFQKQSLAVLKKKLGRPLQQTIIYKHKIKIVINIKHKVVAMELD